MATLYTSCLSFRETVTLGYIDNPALINHFDDSGAGPGRDGNYGGRLWQRRHSTTWKERW